jgi:isopenicillin N synthase-like dioxygenase
MEYIKQMGSLSMHLMQALALSLGLDQGYFDADFKCSPHYQLKVWEIDLYSSVNS